ncbi:MAG: EF-P lysine aminoacylase EpmA [Woeseiaceae bacterium]
MTRWQPSAGVAAARSRASMLRRIRQHFDAVGVLEVDTPALSPFAVSDTQIESFEISRSQVSQRALYLNTSPEFCMKRLLAAGYPDMFSIGRVFRDGESGRRHQPEFTMLEWYRLDFSLREIVGDTIDVIHAAISNDRLVGEPDTFNYRDYFRQTIDLDPIAASIDDLAEAANADIDLRQSIGEHRDDWLDLLLATRISSTFASDRLTVLQHYPASQAALARLCPQDSRVADRFEVFFGAIELANGYVELTDAAEQAARINDDNAERQRRARSVRPHDESLLAAIESGLPRCAGVAMGIERLQMLNDNTDDIRDVISFAFEASK